MKAIDVVKLVKRLLPASYTVKIVGGYARDIGFGMSPSDIDVGIILPTVDQDEQYVFQLMEALSRDLSMFGIRSEVVQAYGSKEGDCVMEGSFSSRLFGDLCVYCSDFKVDFLFSRRDSIQAMVSDFDHNINMYILDSEHTKTPLFLGPINDNPRICHKLIRYRDDNTIPEQRRQSMQAKWECIKEQL